MMTLPRALLAALLLLGGIVPAHADWPETTIRWIVPFGPGGANDLVARVAAEAVSKQLGKPVVIENKPGAGAVIGTDYVAKSRPDGYTFLIGAGGVVVNSLLSKKLPYADSDLVPVGMIAVSPSIIAINPSVPATDLKSFITWAKSRPSGTDWATAGRGTTPHFVAEMLREASGLNLQIVPYKSGGEAVTAVLQNSVPATSEASIVVLPQVRAGNLKAIASTHGKRMSTYPDLPTATEQGFPNIRIGHWAGLYAPKGTPQPIVQRMNAAIQAAMKTPEVKAKLATSDIETAEGSIEDFARYIADERSRLEVYAKSGGMQQD
jgi:tripartite-type tricarboxylate transporter receptor subunit TctC